MAAVAWIRHPAGRSLTTRRTATRLEPPIRNPPVSVRVFIIRVDVCVHACARMAGCMYGRIFASSITRGGTHACMQLCEWTKWLCSQHVCTCGGEDGSGARGGGARSHGSPQCGQAVGGGGKARGFVGAAAARPARQTAGPAEATHVRCEAANDCTSSKVWDSNKTSMKAI